MSLSELFFQVLTLIGGLALFLYGMNVMGDGLTRMSGRPSGKNFGEINQ